MHHAERRPELEPGSPDAGRARSPQRPRPPCPNPFLIGAPLLEIPATHSKHRSGMVSNRSFLGHLLTPAHVRAPGHNCTRFPQPKRQIDTSRNLKSHLNHCKHNASLFPDRQNFGRISVRFLCPCRHHPVVVKLAASEPPSRSSNLRSMLYSLYSEGAATLPQVKSDD